MDIARQEFNKQCTIQHIRSVFLELYAIDGLNSITVSKLCSACGISRATFYLYYTDKYALLEEIEEMLLSGMKTITPRLTAYDIQNIRSGQSIPNANKAFQFLREHTVEFKALMGPHGDSSFIYRWKKAIADTYAAYFELCKPLRINSDLACEIACSAVIGLYSHYLSDPDAMTEDEYCVILANLLKCTLFSLI